MNCSEVQTLTEQLIAKPSVTPNDHGCQQLMISYLESLGFSTENLSANEVSNFWATYDFVNKTSDSLETKTFVFAGHTDVVPTGPITKWKYNPFTPTIYNNNLYGRGAADMKASLAAMLVATKQFIHKVKKSPTNYKNFSLGFMITSDEEGQAIHGTRHIVKVLSDKKQKIDYCIVGEPSSREYLGDIIKNGRRGSVSGHLTIYGIQGHAAYPQKAKNAIHISIDFLNELIKTKWDSGNDDFPPTTLQLISVNAGTGASNVIPGAFDIEFNLRYASCNSFDSLTTKIERMLSQYELQYDIDWKDYARPFLTLQGELTSITQKAVTKITNKPCELATDGGTSDGRFIFPAFNCQLVELGPRNYCIHQIDEHVSLEDLNELAKIYEEILNSLFLK